MRPKSNICKSRNRYAASKATFIGVTRVRSLALEDIFGLKEVHKTDKTEHKTHSNKRQQYQKY